MLIRVDQTERELPSMSDEDAQAIYDAADGTGTPRERGDPPALANVIYYGFAAVIILGGAILCMHSGPSSSWRLSTTFGLGDGRARQPRRPNAGRRLVRD